MAVVTGLRGEREVGRPNRRSLGYRTQVSGADAVRPEGLQPVASPVDTYARPEQLDNGASGLEQLAKTLGAINPVLMGFVETVAPKPDSGAAALRLIQTTDPKVLEQRMKSGDTPVEFQNAAGMAKFAEARAYQRLQELETRYNTGFDRDNGNVNDLITEITGEDYAQFGQDKMFTEVYGRTFEQGRQKLLAAQTDYQNTKVISDRLNVVSSGWDGRITYAVANGVPAEQIAASVWADVPENRQFLALPPKEQQSVILQRADQEYQKGNFDVALALIQHERTDGPYKGSLLTDVEFGSRAGTLQSQIMAEQQKIALEQRAQFAHDQLISDAKNIAMQGGLAGITDAELPTKSGDTKTMTADTIRMEVGKSLIADIDREATERTNSPEEAAILSTKLQKDVFTKNSIEHPQWFSLIKSGYATMTVDAATGPIPPAAKDGYTKYMELFKDSPNYVEKFGDTKSKDFYDVARILQEDGMVKDEDAALRTAFLVTRNPAQLDETDRQRYEDVDAAVDEVAGSYTGSWWNPYGDEAPSNLMDIRREVLSRAKLYARAGLGAEEAMGKAKEAVQRSHINVAGSLVKNHKLMPPSFKDDTQTYLERFATKHNLNLSNLTIMDAGNGVGGYFIIQKDRRLPVEVEGDEEMFTLHTLEDMKKADRDKAITDTVKTRNSK